MISEIRRNFLKEIEAQKSINFLSPSAHSALSALEQLFSAFTQRFGDGREVLPASTPHGNARLGAEMEPSGLTRQQVVASLLHPVRAKQSLAAITQHEWPGVGAAVERYACEVARLEENPQQSVGATSWTPDATEDSELVGDDLGQEDSRPKKKLALRLPSELLLSVPLRPPESEEIPLLQQTIREELEEYRKEVSETCSSGALGWWKSRETKYPKLAALARRLLAIPATSMPLDAVCSEASLSVADTNNSKLSNELMHARVLLKAWFVYQTKSTLEEYDV
jgi:hypothetical protein